MLNTKKFEFFFDESVASPPAPSPFGEGVDSGFTINFRWFKKPYWQLGEHHLFPKITKYPRSNSPLPRERGWDDALNKKTRLVLRGG
jgi:hypothetical protein